MADRNTPRAEQRRKRMREALDYRLNGYSYGDIAEEMNISRSTAHTYVADALREITRDKAEAVLDIELLRLDQLLLATYAQALQGDLQAIDRCLNIMGRIERLHGVETPRTADDTQATYDKLTELLNLAKAKAKAGGD